MNPLVSSEVFNFILTVDTCSIANAIELFNVRLRNEGFSDASLRCCFPEMPPMVGYAMTMRVRAGSPPPNGHAYFDRTDWWRVMEMSPLPRILVVEDISHHPGTGAFVGEVHASILQALGCVGAVTNGAVRDLPAIERAKFHLYSSALSVSHAYMHIVEIGTPVTIAGLTIRQGDLLHGDRHGILTIPQKVADRLPTALAHLQKREDAIIQFCRSNQFTREGLQRLLEGASGQA